VHNPIIQEYLLPEDQEYTSEVFVLSDQTAYGTITMKRELLRGTSVVALCQDYPEIRQEAQKAALALKPLGPCNFQMRLTKNGPTIFEINPRFSGTTVARAQFGFNSPENAIRHFVLGEKPLPPEIESGVMLRYWEEIYLQPAHLERLNREKKIEGTVAHRVDYF
jgi:carbamoyl-phosphate synthase large subunit